MNIPKVKLSRKLFNSFDIKNIDEKIKMLGNSKLDTNTFIFMRFLSTIVLFVFLIYVLKLGYILSPLMTLGYFYLYYYYFLLSPLKKRIKKLDSEALYFFEILTLTLESGRNLENALEVTCFNIDSEISEEFKKTLFEMKFGKSLIEALNDMKKRIPSESINNIILNITQTNIFGNSIIDTMYNQVEFLRDKQILEIKGQINKIPNKISIISVIFVLPIILLLILGPIFINFLG